MKKHAFEEINEYVLDILAEYGISSFRAGGRKIPVQWEHERAEFLPDVLKKSIDSFNEIAKSGGLEPEDHIKQAIHEISLAYQNYTKLDYALIAMVHGEPIRSIYSLNCANIVARLRGFLRDGEESFLPGILLISESLILEIQVDDVEKSIAFEEQLNEVMFLSLLQEVEE